MSVSRHTQNKHTSTPKWNAAMMNTKLQTESGSEASDKIFSTKETKSQDNKTRRIQSEPQAHADFIVSTMTWCYGAFIGIYQCTLRFKAKGKACFWAWLMISVILFRKQLSVWFIEWTADSTSLYFRIGRCVNQTLIRFRRSKQPNRTQSSQTGREHMASVPSYFSTLPRCQQGVVVLTGHFRYFSYLI